MKEFNLKNEFKPKSYYKIGYSKDLKRVKLITNNFTYTLYRCNGYKDYEYVVDFKDNSRITGFLESMPSTIKLLIKEKNI